MFSKKEILITIMSILFFSLLIFALPQLEKIVSNRKTYDYKEEEKKELVVDKYICTFSSKSNVLKNVLEATFYIDNEQVKRIYTKESKTYLKKEDYEEAVKSVEKNIQTDNLEIKVTLDRVNYTIITVRGENILPTSKVKYPTNYHELKTYLEKNNYTCTIRYKK